jgi:hypothetical protein
VTETLPAAHSHVVVVVAAFVAFALLLTILLLFPSLLNAIGLMIERRRPLRPEERARLALAAHYATANKMNDVDLAGLPPFRRQSIWNYLAREWGIRGVRARKRALARQTLDWLRDQGRRADPKLAAPDGTGARAWRRALLASDCARLVFLARLCHFSGYLDDADAWHYIRSAARHLAPEFDSWNDYGEALLEAPDSGPAGAVTALLGNADSPWRLHAWKTAVAP